MGDNMIDATYQLLDALETCEVIKKLRASKKYLKSDSKLLESFSHLSKDELLKIDAVRDYKHYENELFLIVLNINSKIKNIVNTKECG